MANNLDSRQLRQRVRVLLTLMFLLLPTFCGFPLLAFIAYGAIRWVALVVWLAVSGVLVWVIVRLLRAFRTLNES